jgi:hypothetical protein
VKRRYFHIREALVRRHQQNYKAARARGETTCARTGEPLIDLSNKDFTVLAALSRKQLLVRKSTIHNNEEFILIVDSRDCIVERRSATQNRYSE